MKILVAEDNKINQLLLKKLLTKHNISVVVANNGKEAISAVEKEDFDLIFMDIQMPEMDGYEASKYIRSLENEKKRNIPIVALTAAVTEEEKQKVFKVGMNDFVSKPYKEKDILESIKKYVKQ